MIDIKWIRENVDTLKQALIDKRIELDVDRLLELDQQIIKMKQEMEAELTKRNAFSREMKSASPERREEIKELSRQSGTLAAQITERLKPLEDEFKLLLSMTPTIPAPDVPKGQSDADNVVIRTQGEKPVFDFTPLDHVELMEKNGWSDFARVPKICGTRSAAIKGDLFRLEMALWNFALDLLTQKGLTPISVPSLSFEDAFYNMGQFPFDRESVYALPKDNQYLTGTAEAVLNSLHAGEILNEADLPIMYAGFSPCFRREAGAAGKDTRGIFRVHQFTKVEQYVICKADIAESDKMHAFLLNNSEELLTALELPYQVIATCTADMGAGKYRMNDLEVWCPAQGRYRETHSCSTLLDWQARRTNIRYRDNKTGKVLYAYTLNNTGVATPRILVAILENHQQKDGSIRVPKALRPYLHNAEFIGKK